MKAARKPKNTVRCPNCGAPGNRFPGFRIARLGAAMTGTDVISVAMLRLTCRTCWHSWTRPIESLVIIPESEARGQERRPPGAATPIESEATT